MSHVLRENILNSFFNQIFAPRTNASFKILKIEKLSCKKFPYVRVMTCKFQINNELVKYTLGMAAAV